MLSSNSSKKEIKEAKSRKMSDRDKELRDIRQCLKTPAGKRFFTRILQFCHVFQDIPDLNANAQRLLGRRTVGLFLMAEINSADRKLRRDIEDIHYNEIEQQKAKE